MRDGVGTGFPTGYIRMKTNVSMAEKSVNNAAMHCMAIAGSSGNMGYMAIVSDQLVLATHNDCAARLLQT
jgi:hypothetical protein